MSKTYKLTLKDLKSVTDTEQAFGTTKLLPDWNVIPEEFKNGNIYTQIAESMFLVVNCQMARSVSLKNSTRRKSFLLCKNACMPI